MNSDLALLADEELVKVFKKGNEKAFDELYGRYAARLKRLIFYYLNDLDESDDVLHDVFLRVYMHIGSFDTSMIFSSWIYKIAVNCSKNYRKKHRRDAVLMEADQMDVENAGNTASPEEIFLKEDDMRAFYEAVDSLKEKFKMVFLLRFDHGLQFSQISSVLNCPERTAKWRMQKAVEKIIEHLKERGVL
jgi:RNA polymerase sigma-70 factor (ECF subfamily)